ncbi:hypothetical protein [Pseudonocardia sp. 73-21]|uniref:hypothetical protein n=1 Tax=Pseudonocardia sp. 73-21 TaxID=1895809 RepID=UPI002633C272|nr:hypothetical protein [Pseudonocardia sp. 73-21]
MADLLDSEVALARNALGEGRTADLQRDGCSLVMTLVRPDGSWRLRLDGTRYDAEPFDIAFVDDAGEILPLESWPPNYAHGVHPVLGRPWVCVSGTRGFYLYEGHHTERWDAVRYTARADTLLDRLLTKAGM